MKNFTHRNFLFVLLLMLGNSCILTLQAQDCPPPTIQVFELSDSGTAIHAVWSTVPDALSYDLTFSLDGTVLFSTTTTSTTYDWTLPADWATTWSSNSSVTLSITTNCEMGVESQTAASIDKSVSELSKPPLHITSLTSITSITGSIYATVHPVDRIDSIYNKSTSKKQTPSPDSITGSIYATVHPVDRIDFIYHIEQQARISLSLYAITGQKIADILHNQEQTEGSYSVSFNMSELPAGLYVYVFENGAERIANKVVKVQ